MNDCIRICIHSYSHNSVAVVVEPHLRPVHSSCPQGCEASWCPGWVWARPRVEPCSHPHTGAGRCFAEPRGNKPALFLRMACVSVLQNPLCAQFVEIMPLGVQLLAFMKASLCPVLHPLAAVQSLLIRLFCWSFPLFKHRRFGHPFSGVLISLSTCLLSCSSQMKVRREAGCRSLGQVALRRGGFQNGAASPQCNS